MDTKMSNMADDPEFDRKLQVVLDAAERFTMAAMKSCLPRISGGDPGTAGPQAVVMGLTAVAGTLSILSKMLTNKEHVGAPSDDHMLFAAIMVALSCVQGVQDPNNGPEAGMQIEWSPIKMLDALRMFERATGRKFDEANLLEPIIGAAHELERDASNPLASLLAARGTGTAPH